MISAGTSSRFVASRRMPSLLGPVEPPLVLAAAGVWCRLNFQQPNRVPRTCLRFALRAKLHHLIAEHVKCAVGVAQGALFQHRIGTMVTQPTNVAAAGVDDLIEQRELRVTAVHNIGAIRFE